MPADRAGALRAAFAATMKDAEYKAEIEQYKLKIEEAKNDSKDANAEVKTQVVTKTKVIKEKGDTVIQYIDREVVKYDTTCPLPTQAITAHNAAAKNVDPTKATSKVDKK